MWLANSCTAGSCKTRWSVSLLRDEVEGQHSQCLQMTQGALSVLPLPESLHSGIFPRRNVSVGQMEHPPPVPRVNVAATAPGRDLGWSLSCTLGCESPRLIWASQGR